MQAREKAHDAGAHGDHEGASPQRPQPGFDSKSIRSPCDGSLMLIATEVCGWIYFFRRIEKTAFISLLYISLQLHLI